MRISRATLLLAVASFAPIVFGQVPSSRDGTRESRRHLTLRPNDKSRDFVCTVVTRDSDTLASTDVLLEAWQGDRFILTWERDFKGQTSTRQIREVRGKELLRYTIFLPFTARTRTETQAQAHSHPEFTDDKNSRFELGATGSSSFSGGVDEWSDPQRASAWRTRARLMLSAEFLDSLEQLENAGIFRHPALLDLDGILMPLVLYRTDCGRQDQLHLDPLPPDCAFDDHFGFPCSETQKDRAAQYLKSSPPVTKPY